MRLSLATLVLQAALIAQPPLGQQTRVTAAPGGIARRSAPAPRRGLTALDQLALSAARLKRQDREARNLRNAEGFSRA